MKLHDVSLVDKDTSHLLAIYIYMLMNPGGGAAVIMELGEATPDERGEFYIRLATEIDRRIPQRVS